MLLRTLTVFVVLVISGHPVLIFEKTCYRRVINGRRLDERFIRHSLPCDALEACQHQCSVEKHFQCQGFNVRLDKKSSGRGICELTAIPTSYLDSSRDFLYDPEFDYYEKDNSNNSPNCGYVNEVINVVPKNGAEDNPYGRHHSGGPYYGGDSYGPWSTGYGGPEHGPWGPNGYGSGYYISNNPSRGPTPHFRPKHHSTRHYGSGEGRIYHNTHPNEIPDYPDKGRSGKDFNRRELPSYVIVDANENERQFRSYNDVGPYRPNYPQQPQFPRPPYRPPYLNPGPQDNFHGPFPNDYHNEVCFQRAHPGYKLDPSCIRTMVDMPSVLDCEAACTKSPFKCTGYSYRYTRSQDRSPNCALTDYPSLNPNINLVPDRGCDVYFKMNSCLDHHGLEDTECFTRVISNQKITPELVRTAIRVRGVSDCELECLRSSYFTCRSFTFRYGPGVIGEPIENCIMSDWPISALRARDFVPAPEHEIYERGSFGHGCEVDVGPPYIGPRPDSRPPYPVDKYPWNRDETWRRFTVKGWPCRAGTTCQLNQEAGFWSCEIEGGDHAQWDYCCRPGHSCGFSKGFNYPWCYVGEARPDQWRPCNEQYYPNYNNKNPYPPYEGDTYLPPRGDRPWNYNQDEYGPPSYWPVSYLYNEPPPNETDSWQQQKHHHHHHHHYHDDSPKIRFKPSPDRPPYPKAVIQKLDVKDTPPAADPGDEEQTTTEDDQPAQELNPRINYGKKLEMIPEADVRLFSSTTAKPICDKENLKNQVESFSSTTIKPFFLSNLTADVKRELSQKIQEDIIKQNKTKEILKEVEKIIENSKDLEELEKNKKNNKKEVEEVSKEKEKNVRKEQKNETELLLTADSSENIGVAVKYLDVSRFRPRDEEEDSAMHRFWSWGQERYSQSTK